MKATKITDAPRRCGCKLLALALTASTFLWFSPFDALAAVVKCVDANGKVSYQESICAEQSKAQTTLKVPVPAASASAQSGAPVPPSGVQTKKRSRVPTEQDFKGPREAWQRLEQALHRGDRDAALKELTPAAQQRLSETIDRLANKTKSPEADQWGPVRSVTLPGDDTATVTLSRKTSDGTYADEVMLMRGSDGKWRVDNM